MDKKNLHQNLLPHLFIVALLFTAFVTSSCNREIADSNTIDRLPTADEIDYRPADGEVSATNPPAFIWLPVEDTDSYILQYSSSKSFHAAGTTTVNGLTMTVHIPTSTIAEGTWYWRFGVKHGEEIDYSRTRSFTIPKEAVEFPLLPIEEVLSRIPQSRPRLNFTPELISKIRADKDGEYHSITAEVIDEAEMILQMNEPLFEEPRPWDESDNPRMAYVNAFTSMRPYTRRMITSALAYNYTGDERFAMEAKRRLMHFMDWDVEGTSRTIYPTELGMDIAENAPPVFDWIYPVLTEEERDKCVKVLSARMHQINHHVHRNRPMETRPFSSHPGRMVGFVVEGSIALAHEVPEVAEWLDYTLKLLWSTYPAWSKNEGGWNEGISYWGSYMGRMIRVVAQLDKYNIPLKNKPFFRNTGNFGLYAAYPHRPTKAFGDGLSGPLGGGHGNLMYNLSTLYKNPYFRWHANISGVNIPTGRDAFLFLDNTIKADEPDDIPQSTAFYDVGLVAMHSNMADLPNNVLMLFQSNPFGSQSHNHSCQNAFVIEAYGEPLAISSGTRQLHGSAHHTEWMWHTKAHNSILVDHEGQTSRSRESKGEIIYYDDQGGYVITTGDATQAYGNRLKRFHRNILFIRPNYFVIVDDLITNETESTFQWLLHSQTEIRANREMMVLQNGSGHTRMTTRFLTPSDINFTQHSGFTPQVHDSSRFQNQFHLTASTTEPASAKQIITLICVDRDKQLYSPKPNRPSTPRKEINIKNIDQSDISDKLILSANLLKAEGGAAIRLGDDLILWRSPDSKKVYAEGVNTEKPMEYIKDHFK